MLAARNGAAIVSNVSAICMTEAIWAVTVSRRWVGSLDLKQRSSSADSGATILLTADAHTERTHAVTKTQTHPDADMSELYLKRLPMVTSFSH